MSFMALVMKCQGCSSNAIQARCFDGLFDVCTEYA